MKQLITLATGIVVGLALVYATLAGPYFASASAPSGLPATIATSSRVTVSTAQRLVFSTSSCAARIISTASSTATITFEDLFGQVPSEVFGHVQATGTTVVYDSGQFGCGPVRVYSYLPQQITVSESR